MNIERLLKEDFFKAFPEAKEVFIDGTERPIQRPRATIKGKEHDFTMIICHQKSKNI